MGQKEYTGQSSVSFLGRTREESIKKRGKIMKIVPIEVDTSSHHCWAVYSSALGMEESIKR